MKSKGNTVIGLMLALIALVSVFIIEQFIKPGYAVKSFFKVLFLAGAILLYSLLTHNKIVETINFRKLRNFRTLLYSVAFCFAGMALVFVIFYRFLDLDAIRASLVTKENLTRENCRYVFTYIIICNSFLEEAFFRGYVTGIFENHKVGAVVSAVLFALYHIGIVATWFDPLIFIICISGLAIVGLFLQWLCDNFGSVKASWIAHASANVAINIIGALLIFELI